MLVGCARAFEPIALPDLSSDELAFRWYCASGGVIGLVLKIFKEKGCDLILTSEKDYIKWKEFEGLKDKILYPLLKLKISNEERFYNLLEEKMRNG